MNLSNHRILVTGGAGFLGHHVCEQLCAADVDVGAIFVPRSCDYDLTNEAAVVRMYAEMRPTIVVHLAAVVGGIGANRENPGRYFHANLAMGMHLIEHARRTGVEKFVQVGTVCSYPKYTPVPFVEEDLWKGFPEETNAAYGVAKKALLVMLQAYRAQYGLNGIYLLPANLYGPGDNFDTATSHVIPALVRRFCEAKANGESRVSVWGTGKPSREFLYVEDCARAIVMATQRYDGADPVNVGTGSEITIEDLVGLIRTHVGYHGDVHWDHSKPDGQPRRCLDTSRAKKAFGFEAQTGLGDGLGRTIEWYRGHV
ncbi:MAG: GDP-L-fucose synthase [Phycisphaerales bacterium]|nr:GDP-L-fucose synthase [Phycisphaerales bacterium]MCB9858629.1 GDP-L-fucose synthase [Phycisphaerales bacterium]